MKITDRINDWVDDIKAKRLQRILVKTNNEAQIVNALPPDKDNSKVNIHKVVKSMENPETKIGRASCRERVWTWV